MNWDTHTQPCAMAADSATPFWSDLVSSSRAGPVGCWLPQLQPSLFTNEETETRIWRSSRKVKRPQTKRGRVSLCRRVFNAKDWRGKESATRQRGGKRVTGSWWVQTGCRASQLIHVESRGSEARQVGQAWTSGQELRPSLKLRMAWRMVGGGAKSEVGGIIAAKGATRARSRG